MKFIINRTSNWRGDKPSGLTNTYKQMVFYADGTPNKEMEYIDVNSLEELIDISKKLDEDLVLSPEAIWDESVPSLEIYDDYRE